MQEKLLQFIEQFQLRVLEFSQVRFTILELFVILAIAGITVKIIF